MPFWETIIEPATIWYGLFKLVRWSHKASCWVPLYVWLNLPHRAQTSQSCSSYSLIYLVPTCSQIAPPPPAWVLLAAWRPWSPARLGYISCFTAYLSYYHIIDALPGHALPSKPLHLYINTSPPILDMMEQYSPNTRHTPIHENSTPPILEIPQIHEKYSPNTRHSPMQVTMKQYSPNTRHPPIHENYCPNSRQTPIHENYSPNTRHSPIKVTMKQYYLNTWHPPIQIMMKLYSPNTRHPPIHENRTLLILDIPHYMSGWNRTPPILGIPQYMKTVLPPYWHPPIQIMMKLQSRAL